MEKDLGRFRNLFCYTGIILAVISSFSQLLNLPANISFYFAVGGISALVIGLILMVVIYFGEKKSRD